MVMQAAAGPVLPLARWADRQLRTLAAETGSAQIAALTSGQILGERARINQFTIPGRISAGGGCHLLATRTGDIALNLARADDRDLLPALFGAAFDPLDDGAIARHASACDAAALVALGREMGLAIASVDEAPLAPPVTRLTAGPSLPPIADRAPLVLDLSALWAGPLAAHLLWLSGAQVIKLESPNRPDAMRQGDPGLFALLNQGKASVTLDLRQTDGIAALHRLIARADIVIEAARPRALRQLGVDADALVRARSGLTWMTITGHGATGAAADWVGFGDDCGVAAGLSRALTQCSGASGFVGDAIADPLTGLIAAREAWRGWRSGASQRIGLAMSAIAHLALQEDMPQLRSDLAQWAAQRGQPFPHHAPRALQAPLCALGADNARWLPC